MIFDQFISSHFSLQIVTLIPSLSHKTSSYSNFYGMELWLSGYVTGIGKSIVNGECVNEERRRKLHAGNSRISR